MVDRLCFQMAFFVDTKFHVLIHMLGDEWDMGTHQNIDLHENIEEDIHTD